MPHYHYKGISFKIESFHFCHHALKSTQKSFPMIYPWFICSWLQEKTVIILNSHNNIKFHLKVAHLIFKLKWVKYIIKNFKCLRTSSESLATIAVAKVFSRFKNIGHWHSRLWFKGIDSNLIFDVTEIQTKVRLNLIGNYEVRLRQK